MQEVHVTLVGTGATAPTPQRHLACTLVRIGGLRVLIDCGEGTQVQLARQGVSLPSIDLLLLTHYHADHYLGITGLLSTRALHGAAPLAIWGHDKALDRLSQHLRTADALGGCTFTGLGQSEHLEVAAGWDLETVRMEHGASALGYVLVERDLLGRFDAQRADADGVPGGPVRGRLARGNDVEIDGRVWRSSDYVADPRPGRKIAISGDTAPCARFAHAARGSTLMIHEATYRDEDAPRARKTRHCTASQAGRVAMDANAHELWLTHISSRYAAGAATRLAREAQRAAGDTRVRLGHDGMSARVGQTIDIGTDQTQDKDTE